MEFNGKRPANNRDNVSPPPSRKRKLTSTATKEAVHSFFTPASQKPSGNITWASIESTLLIAHFKPSSSDAPLASNDKRRRVAAFDLDSTLIRPASGRKFSKDADDWMWWHPSVPKRLRDLDSDGYRIVIISNQSGINLKQNTNTAKIDAKRLADFKSKVTSILKQLDLSLSFYAATERDRYRKPRTGAWVELLEHFDLDSETDGVDLDSSMFVGDAGGRISADKEKDKDVEGKDFASSDLDFASNVGIKFITPDEYFLGKAARPFERSFQPRKYLNTSYESAPFAKTNPRDIVCLTGSPGAGKSTFYWKNLAPLGYERVNQDQLKTRDNCLQAASGFLRAGKSVVVDNTNADPDTRAHWVELAGRFGVPIRCVCLKSEPKLCEHNDAVRALNGPLMNPESRTRLPVLAFASFAKRYRPPSLEEGFQDIITVAFRFVGTAEQEAAWTQYYV